MNLYSLFKRQVDLRPDAAALIDAGNNRRWSFAEIEHASRDMAARLADAGLQRGDGVLLFVPMSVRLYVTLLACFRLGLVAIVIDPYAGREHVERCCRRYPPKAMIGTPKAQLLRLRIPALRRIEHHFSSLKWLPATRWLPLTADTDAADLAVELAPSEPALVTFTSGSTALPKVAVRSHGFLHRQHCVIDNNQSLEAGATSLTLFPVFVLSSLAAGITSVLAAVDLRRPQRIDPRRLLATIERYRPDSLGLQPIVVSRLANFCRRRGLEVEGDFVLYSGGAPVFPAVLERFGRIAPGARMISVYGSTEAEPITLTEMNRAAVRRVCPRKGLLAGHPVDEIDLRILPPTGDAPFEMSRTRFDALCLDAGEIGEIVVRGKHVLESYLDGEGDRDNKYRVDGQAWHRTGDAGSLDREGRLWLAGRCLARIADSRGICYPLGIEAAAMQLPAVDRVALGTCGDERVLVVACRRAQRRVVAASLRDLLDEADIDRLQFVSEIPVDRRHNGKVDYRRLQTLLQARTDSGLTLETTS